ncbi:LysR family transcriptional regulator [Intrasporangium mesophilum]
MDLDLRLVRYFAAVAEELHFGRAAARLYVSQPALSKQIRKLEEQLGEPLLVRDSRHVALTPRGQRFYQDAQRLLAIADTMQQPPQARGMRTAHVFELSTSRTVADAFARAHPEVPLLEHAMDSITQLNAVMDRRLDVAILRVTPRMLVSHPDGWCHRLLRMEPLVLVGPKDDERKPTASLYERPVDVFGDPPESGTYNAHGQYLTSLEHDLGLSMRWLGTPGAFSHCLAHVSRATGPSRYLEFFSYAQKYVEAGLPMYWPEEVQPYYPWSLAWRKDDDSPATHQMLAVAADVARREGWLDLSVREGPEPPFAPPWLPPDEPVRTEAFRGR